MISDFGEIEKLTGQTLPTNFLQVGRATHCLAQMMNAGIDTWMVPGWRRMESINEVWEGMKKAV